MAYSGVPCLEFFYDEINGALDSYQVKVPMLCSSGGCLTGVLPDLTATVVPTADATTGAYTADATTGSVTADSTSFNTADAIMLGQNVKIKSSRFGLDGTQNYAIREYVIDTGKMEVSYTVRGLRT